MANTSPTRDELKKLDDELSSLVKQEKEHHPRDDAWERLPCEKERRRADLSDIEDDRSADLP